MRSPDDIRAEIDRGENVVVLHAKPKRQTPKLGARWVFDAKPHIDVGVIDGLLGPNTLTVLFGESGAGKSFFAVDMAAHIAAAKDWRGYQVTPGPILYVAAERPQETENRFIAWARHHQVPRLEVMVTSTPIDLLDPGGSTGEIVHMIEQMAADTGNKVPMIVVDTLARSMVGGNENSGEDVSQLVANLDYIREKTGVAVLLVHHAGKDASKGARGWSGLKAAADAEIELTADRVATVTKSSAGEDGIQFCFELQSVALGENANGRSVATCLATETATLPRKSRRRRELPDGAKVALKALDIALHNCGQKPPTHDETREVIEAVSLADWRSYFKQISADIEPEKSPATLRSDWRRAWQALVARDYVKVWGEGSNEAKKYVWKLP